MPRGASQFVLLCSTGLFAIFSSTLSKSPVLPLFATYLGADPFGVGLVASLSSFTGIVASIPSGMLSDRFGRKKMLFFALTIFATAPFLYLAVHTLWQLILVRLYHGFATAIFIPVAMALVADLYHKERGEKMGWFSTATLLGRFMAPLAGGLIISALAFNPGLSFQAVYLLCAAAGLAAFVIALKVPDTGAKATEQSWKETLTALKSVLGTRAILLACMVEAAILFAYGGFETFLPLYCITSGLTAYKAGVLLSVQVVTLALTKPVMGKFSDRHGRTPQICWGALLGALTIGTLGFINSFLPLLLLSIVFGWSLSIVTSATSAYIADRSSRHSHGSAMGLLGAIMDIGHTAGPLVAGALVFRSGFAQAFMAASAILACAALLFYVFTHAKTCQETSP